MESNVDYPEEWLEEAAPETGVFQYVSLIKVNGRPILPPILTVEKRREILQWRRAAIAREAQRTRRHSSSSSDGIGRTTHSTPVRPVTLNLRSQKAKHNSIENRLAQDSESDLDVEGRRWSPLQTEPLRDMVVCKQSVQEETQDTPETVTGSPRNGSLHRQHSYTLLTPGPALLSSLAKDQERSQSGRRTWDLQTAQNTWYSHRPVPDTDEESDLSAPDDDSRMTQVPCTDDVPSSLVDPSGQSITVPKVVREKLNNLTVMMMSLKMKHEKERLELEEKQRVEQGKFEVLFKEKITDLLGLKQCTSVPGRDRSEVMSRSVRSAGDAPARLRARYQAQNGRPRSADPFGSATDIDVSFREDSYVSRGTNKKEEMYDTWSLSSRASTLSNEPAPVTYRLDSKYRVAQSAELERYNKAAAKICAAVKGYLTRRLLRTEYVKDLLRSLRDTIHMAETLKDDKDLQHSSDLNFMKGLTRQITSNWGAIYEVFHYTSKEKQMQLIAADRARMRTSQTRSMPSQDSAKMMSSATLKSLSRKQKAMSTSLTGFPRSSSFSRSCFKMSTSLSGALPPRRP